MVFASFVFLPSDTSNTSTNTNCETLNFILHEFASTVKNILFIFQTAFQCSHRVPSFTNNYVIIWFTFALQSQEITFSV